MLVAQKPELEKSLSRKNPGASLSSFSNSQWEEERGAETRPLTSCLLKLSLAGKVLFPPIFWPWRKFSGKAAPTSTRKFNSMTQAKQPVIAFDLSHFLTLKEKIRDVLNRHPIKPAHLCRRFWHDKQKKNPLEIVCEDSNNINKREIAAHYGSIVNMDKLSVQRVV